MRIQAAPRVYLGNRQQQPLTKRLEAFLAENGLGKDQGKSIQIGCTPEKTLQVIVENADDETAVTTLLRAPNTLVTSFEGIPVEVVRIYGFPPVN